MKKVLIIGGSGLLGSALVNMFEDAYVTYNSTKINIENSFKLDISDIDSLKFLLEKIEPETIIVTAALTDVDKCEIHPELAYKINRDPFPTIISYLRGRSGRLIQVSTDYVFSGEKGNYREEDERNPLNVYGRSKMEAEDLIIASDINYTIIRTSGIFGANRSTGKTNFFTWIYNNLREKREINLVTDQYYSPALNMILARAIEEIYDREINGIIHFSSLDFVSRFDFGNIIAEIFDLDRKSIKPVKMEDMKWNAKRPNNSSLNNDRALRTLYTKPVAVSQEINMIKELIESGASI